MLEVNVALMCFMSSDCVGLRLIIIFLIAFLNVC